MHNGSVFVAIIGATYAAILAACGFLLRSVLRSRRREAARIDQLRRRVRKLRIVVRTLGAAADAGARTAGILEQVRQDIAVIASELEALQAWQAAQTRRGTSDPPRL